MEQYIARQPILNAHKKLYGYELLYRGANDYKLADVSGNRATMSLLSGAFLTKEIKELSGNKPCFINFTQDLLERNIPASFPKNQIVVEVLEEVEPTAKVLSVCKKLHKDGYTIALDDFIFHKKWLPILEFAQIIKIDVRLTPLDTLIQTLNKLAPYDVKLLAEKVETEAEFIKASKMGFTYFQGYFFSKPEQIQITEIPSNKVSLLGLLHEITLKKTTLNRLHAIISTDIAISYKILRFLNSAYFYRLEKVKSVKHAIAYLGEKELRRFLMLVIISELSTDTPNELVRLVLVRAKFCELLGEASPYKEDSPELFLLGLFSSLDAMLNVPMDTVLQDLPLTEAVKMALTHQTGVLADFFRLALAVERNQGQLVKSLVGELEIDSEKVRSSYMVAIKYANGLL